MARSSCARISRHRGAKASIACPQIPPGDHRKHEIFSVHETGDGDPKDVRNHECDGDVSEQTMQFAGRALRLLSAL